MSLSSWSAATVLLIVFAGSAGAQSQTALPQTLTLSEAIDYASTHYPSVKAALAHTSAAMATGRAARTAYLPRLDGVWQTNRATSNNIIGLLLPQSVVPSISGPPFAAASGSSVWGTAAGALLSWEAFDLGLRDATVREADATLARARASEAVTRLDVQQAVALAYLAVAEAQLAVAAADADVQRREVLNRTVHTLVDNQLRPGADASRADAELAAAHTRAIAARRDLALGHAALARMLGSADATIALDTSSLLAAPSPGASRPPSQHPLSTAGDAAVAEAQAREEVLARSNRPRVYLQSSLSARGSGINTDGTFRGGAGGLGFDRANWAAGVQVIVPNLFDFATLHARQAAAEALTRAETARSEETRLSLASERRAADAAIEAAEAIAQQVPLQYAAARQAEAQARARYDAGLAGLVEVAEAQNLLAAAEYQKASTMLDVWRARLRSAVADGDLAPFVSALTNGGGR